DVISRQGGNEFTILLNRISHHDDVVKAVERIYKSIREPFQLDGHEVHTTGSMGIALYPNDGLSMENLLMQADTAMVYAKKNGRNGYTFFQPEMNEQIS